MNRAFLLSVGLVSMLAVSATACGGDKSSDSAPLVSAEAPTTGTLANSSETEPAATATTPAPAAAKPSAPAAKAAPTKTLTPFLVEQTILGWKRQKTKFRWVGTPGKDSDFDANVETCVRGYDRAERGPKLMRAVMTCLANKGWVNTDFPAK